jgi:hypothetical protein
MSDPLEGRRHDTVQLSMGRVLTLGLGRYATAAGEIAGEVATRIGITADVRPPEAGRMLAEALGVPGPCAVTYDMADTDTCTVLTAALEAFAENRIPQQRELAALAGRMRARALAARNAGHPQAAAP